MKFFWNHNIVENKKKKDEILEYISFRKKINRRLDRGQFSNKFVQEFTFISIYLQWKSAFVFESIKHEFNGFPVKIVF